MTDTRLLVPAMDGGVHNEVRELLGPYVDGFMCGPSGVITVDKESGPQKVHFSIDLIRFDGPLPEMSLIRHIEELKRDGKLVYMYTLHWETKSPFGHIWEYPHLLCRMAAFEKD